MSGDYEFKVTAYASVTFTVTIDAEEAAERIADGEDLFALAREKADNDLLNDDASFDAADIDWEVSDVEPVAARR